MKITNFLLGRPPYKLTDWSHQKWSASSNGAREVSGRYYKILKAIIWYTVEYKSLRPHRQYGTDSIGNKYNFTYSMLKDVAQFLGHCLNISKICDMMYRILTLLYQIFKGVDIFHSVWTTLGWIWSNMDHRMLHKLVCLPKCTLSIRQKRDRLNTEIHEILLYFSVKLLVTI